MLFTGEANKTFPHTPFLPGIGKWKFQVTEKLLEVDHSPVLRQIDNPLIEEVGATFPLFRRSIRVFGRTKLGLFFWCFFRLSEKLLSPFGSRVP